jgi:glycosyltransferase involved in cell wall biosynthesis
MPSAVGCILEPFIPGASMRIVLNAAPAELARMGGDYTHYRDWKHLGQFMPDTQIELVPDGFLRSASFHARRGFEWLTRTWEPTALRHGLLAAGRRLRMPPRSLERADLVMTHLHLATGTSGRLPVIWSSQGISPDEYYVRVDGGRWLPEDVRWLYGSAGARVTILAITTQSCARRVSEACPELDERIRVVPPPVFAEGNDVLKPSIRDGRMRLLFVGLDPDRKGLAEVMSAYRRVRSDEAEIELTIVTRPSASLAAAVARLRGAQLVTSSQEVNVKALMRSADLFVVPTHADTYLLAAVEAMAYGCVPIVTDLEPLPEVVAASEGGLTVPIGSSDAIAQHVKRLLAGESELRARQGICRAVWEQRNAPAAVAPPLAAVFRDAIDLGPVN